MHEIRLTGLNGDNLLAYMAALGTFRVLSMADTSATVRLKWIPERAWTPMILHSRIQNAGELVVELEREVCGESSVNEAWTIAEDLTLGVGEFRSRLQSCLAACWPEKRSTADYLAAFGSDGIGSGPKKEQMSDTEFRTMSGAGHQHFLGFMKELAIGTSAAQLTRALFLPWDYGDGRPSLRWDPADYRPHALRANDPSGDPIRTMRGANRLAVEALPLFPTAPEGRRLRTVGFEDRVKESGKETELTWPVWSEFLDWRTVASLLALADLQKEKIGAKIRSSLKCRGIEQVFRVKRFTDGKYRNFSPSRALL